MGRMEADAVKGSNSSRSRKLNQHEKDAEKDSFLKMMTVRKVSGKRSQLS